MASLNIFRNQRWLPRNGHISQTFFLSLHISSGSSDKENEDVEGDPNLDTLTLEDPLDGAEENREEDELVEDEIEVGDMEDADEEMGDEDSDSESELDEEGMFIVKDSNSKIFVFDVEFGLVLHLLTATPNWQYTPYQQSLGRDYLCFLWLTHVFVEYFHSLFSEFGDICFASHKQMALSWKFVTNWYSRSLLFLITYYFEHFIGLKKLNPGLPVALLASLPYASI